MHAGTRVEAQWTTLHDAEDVERRVFTGEMSVGPLRQINAAIDCIARIRPTKLPSGGAIDNDGIRTRRFGFCIRPGFVIQSGIERSARKNLCCQRSLEIVANKIDQSVAQRSSRLDGNPRDARLPSRPRRSDDARYFANGAALQQHRLQGIESKFGVAAGKFQNDNWIGMSL